ncbi:T9SS type A sorting domain-containing protein [Flavobacterium sp. F-65]|uniref:T9SS type A sorting domain-containing protein n=1 Tax=Flavobacterium pisciphilum TaxID=2893755 RepID=A0ABS8MY76_9FLAO|nr:T9SS type A sorting domain-containing protein [Flavobacterium sp. F-65]MCC9073729.1 T9SS type A sorting domain-containing protein [Flavobacterium sp. F-65]
MKKKYFYYILFLLLNTTLLFGQKVTLTPLVVNGKSFTSGPLNLESTPISSVSLNVKVDSPAPPGDNGTINVYYLKANALGASIPSGGNGGTLLFGGGKTANRQFVISLNWNDFSTSGGYVYAEYKNATGVVYKSASIAVIKNSTLGGGTLTPPADAPNPANIANTLCCNQTVRLGEKPSLIIGSQYANPYANYNYGINSSWSATGNSTIKFLSTENQTLELDYITELKNFTVSRGLGYNNTLNHTNKSNTITVTVVPSPISRNEITIDASIDENNFAEITNTNPKMIIGNWPTVNLNTLQDPFNTPKRSDTYAEIEKYEWQYGLTNKTYPIVNNWTTLPNENSASLNSSSLPILSDSEDNVYLVRRIAIYKDLKITSNSLKIVLRTVRNNNTICCDQALIISASNTISTPTLIIGSDATPETNQYLKYQWQSQSIDNNNSGKISNWSNIVGATSKDYLPPTLQLVSSNRRGEITWSTPVIYNYRRVTEPQYYNGIFSYSNEINLSSINYKNSESSVIIYPNPATSVINIKNKNFAYKPNNLNLNIVNIMGQIVNSNNFSLVDPYTISINISDLPIGTYFINLQSTPSRTTQLKFYKTN